MKTIIYVQKEADTAEQRQEALSYLEQKYPGCLPIILFDNRIEPVEREATDIELHLIEAIKHFKQEFDNLTKEKENEPRN